MPAGLSTIILDTMKERRKEIIRAYKRTPKEMGVYVIRNTVTGKCYVAAHRDLKARINRHKLELKTGSERLVDLQKDWHTYGPDAFVFEIIERLDPLDDPAYDPADDLKVLERLWLEKLQPFGEKGYNKPLIGG